MSKLKILDGAQNFSFIFQNIGAVRVDILHSSYGDLAGVAGILLHPAVPIHPCQGQTLGKMFLLFHLNCSGVVT